MKGTSDFTRTEATRIRQLLVELRGAERPRQKAIRTSLRLKLRFYITDWDSSRRGFTASDFDRLVDTALIAVRPG